VIRNCVSSSRFSVTFDSNDTSTRTRSPSGCTPVIFVEPTITFLTPVSPWRFANSASTTLGAKCSTSRSRSPVPRAS
jgi:hypothetical protein